MFTDTGTMTEQQKGFVSTHRNVVSIDVVVIWTAMDNREFHPRGVIWKAKQEGK